MIAVTLAALLSLSPLQETADRAPLWGTPSIDIFDTNELFYACINPSP